MGLCLYIYTFLLDLPHMLPVCLHFFSIIELSEGDNLGDNDNFPMIFLGLITSPKVTLVAKNNSNKFENIGII